MLSPDCVHPAIPDVHNEGSGTKRVQDVHNEGSGTKRVQDVHNEGSGTSRSRGLHLIVLISSGLSDISLREGCTELPKTSSCTSRRAVIDRLVNTAVPSTRVPTPS